MSVPKRFSHFLAKAEVGLENLEIVGFSANKHVTHMLQFASRAEKSCARVFIVIVFLLCLDKRIKLK